MNKRIFRILAGIAAALLILIILMVAVGPFLVPVRPLEGLVSPQEAAHSESRFITIPFKGTDGIDIHYLESGDDSAVGPTFILLHGSNFNAFTWTEVMDFFAREGRVIAYDQIPYGLSEKLLDGEWAARNPYSTEAAVDQLFLLLDALEVERAVLVGSSYGGTLAVQAALAQPERVEALILTDAAVYVEEEMPAWLLNLPQVRRIGPLFARMLGQNEDFIRMTYLDPEKISSERMALTLIQTQVQDWDYAYWEYLRAWGTGGPEYQNRIPEITQPSLVISGEGDAVVPVADSQRLYDALPNAELAILPSCGHVPQEECPDQFEAAVGAWLDR